MKQKLIDQLIHRAGARFGGDGINYDGFVPSKFAELIIRECAWIANDPAPSVYDHDSYKLGRKFAGIDVLKHFGVEE